MASLSKQNSLVISLHRTPHSWFTPTHLYLSEPTTKKEGSWQSRRARKGRYSPKQRHIHDDSSHVSETQKVELRMQEVESELKPGLKLDISFWIALVFTLGSAIWVVNGFLVWIPILRPDLASDQDESTAAALAFLGGTVFEVGSYLMVLEALDRGRETSFGTALGQILHHRRHLPHTVEKPETIDIGTSEKGRSTPQNDKKEGFIWWGKPLWHDMGYLAAFVQLCAASIFWIATLTGLPGVIPGLYSDDGSVAVIDVFYWSPQVVGGSGFIISSLILMLEVQTRWYKPALGDIGWWVGAWNLVGAIGFTLCGALGYSPSDGAVYQSGLSTWWGSWAFLFGSILQVWEVVWREAP